MSLLVVRDVGAADAPPAAPPDPPDSSAASPAERRCNALADRVQTRAAELRTRSANDVVLLLEAIEIAEVADELVAEGDVELAASLFEEALALLELPEIAP